MNFLRDRWRRCAIYQYFAELGPGDRATVYIVLVLLTAWAVAFSAIVRHREPALSLQPRLTAPPFAMGFA